MYGRGAGVAPRVRGLPYNATSSSTTELIAGKFKKGIRSRRLFLCHTKRISLDTPIEATPTTPTEKKNPDRTVRTDRRVIADMRRINVGFEVSQYYHVRVPPIESIARLLVSMAASLPGFDIAMVKRDIASAFRLLRLHHALSLLMCTELAGCFLGHSHYLVSLNLIMPFGWNGSPAYFAILGDAIARTRAQFGMGRPDWFLSIHFLPKLYVGDGLLFDIRNAIRQQANAIMWESITVAHWDRRRSTWPSWMKRRRGDGGPITLW